RGQFLVFLFRTSFFFFIIYLFQNLFFQSLIFRERKDLTSDSTRSKTQIKSVKRFRKHNY
ncbi:hypothetical protein GIB67_031099, partial [Kingdonia uniflora]